MHRISNQNKNRNGDFKMNKAVIYFGATGNEAADQMVMQVLEEYCTVNGYEVVAVISENARPEGMTFPMKFAFVGMAEVEDVDVVVTLMSDMVGDCEETIWITSLCSESTALRLRQQTMIWLDIIRRWSRQGKRKITVLFHLLILWQYFSDVSEPTDRRFYE